MNAGSISTRYGKAFLKYVVQEGVHVDALSQAERLLAAILSLPALKDVLLNRPDLDFSRRAEIAASAISGELLPQMARFLELLETHSRMGMLDRILWSFILQCRRYCNIKSATLLLPVPDEELEKSVRRWIESQTDAVIRLDSKVDESLLGGFILEFDGKRLDASVRRQLQILQKELVDKNNRIV